MIVVFLLAILIKFSYKKVCQVSIFFTNKPKYLLVAKIIKAYFGTIVNYNHKNKPYRFSIEIVPPFLSYKINKKCDKYEFTSILTKLGIGFTMHINSTSKKIFILYIGFKNLINKKIDSIMPQQKKRRKKTK
ncbi:hypothetical protein BpHYR1_031026 [Brachionus plicatilis]|uniref:Uncharacterized protein n=1 Tax=Brachionus plicatilis TaxID=10195 RepID=A0A3M7PJX4_BRAPC|nr:hypothetical protein BpHYR1_031026 [Brachionus plicatilis]